MRDPALEDLFARRGAITRIATELGISTAAVSQWKRVPDDRVVDVARILGVAPTAIRPDLTAPPAPRADAPAVRMAPRPVLRRRRRTKIIATLGPASSSLEVIERLHREGIRDGLGAFNPPGTSPPLVGIAVPEDYPLPEGYVRHHQTTDDGQDIEAILMFSPDYQFFDAAGQPIQVPANRVVPPQWAPSGLPIRQVRIPPPLAAGEGGAS